MKVQNSDETRASAHQGEADSSPEKSYAIITSKEQLERCRNRIPELVETGFGALVARELGDSLGVVEKKVIAMLKDWDDPGRRNDRATVDGYRIRIAEVAPTGQVVNNLLNENIVEASYVRGILEGMADIMKMTQAEQITGRWTPIAVRAWRKFVDVRTQVRDISVASSDITAVVGGTVAKALDAYIFDADNMPGEGPGRHTPMQKTEMIGYTIVMVDIAKGQETRRNLGEIMPGDAPSGGMTQSDLIAAFAAAQQVTKAAAK